MGDSNLEERTILSSNHSESKENKEESALKVKAVSVQSKNFYLTNFTSPKPS